MTGIPRFTLDGVQNARISYHPFATEDGLGLHMLRFHRKDTKNVVLLSHGLTTSTDMFVMPEHRNLVSYLLDNGYSDVWSIDWRGSLRHIYNLFPHRYTLDDVARFDYPPAIDLIRKNVGPDANIHAIVHCVGSLTFFMSILGGSINGISSIISNSVSIIPRVPTWSFIKLHLAPFFVEYIMRYTHVNPRWQSLPGPAAGKRLAWLLTRIHTECDVPECRMLSVLWGTGRPACYEHANLDERTHARLGDLFGATTLQYFRHIRRMVRNGFLRPFKTDEAHDPGEYSSNINRLQMPILFLTGKNNHIFTDSNTRAHSYLADHGGNAANQFAVFPGYGHQDTLMGKNADTDIFPVMLSFLDAVSGKHMKIAGAI